MSVDEATTYMSIIWNKFVFIKLDEDPYWLVVQCQKVTMPLGSLPSHYTVAYITFPKHSVSREERRF